MSTSVALKKLVATSTAAFAFLASCADQFLREPCAASEPLLEAVEVRFLGLGRAERVGVAERLQSDERIVRDPDDRAQPASETLQLGGEAAADLGRERLRLRLQPGYRALQSVRSSRGDLRRDPRPR